MSLASGKTEDREFVVTFFSVYDGARTSTIDGDGARTRELHTGSNFTERSTLDLMPALSAPQVY